jgi:hypothetical protein
LLLGLLNSTIILFMISAMGSAIRLVTYTNHIFLMSKLWWLVSGYVGFDVQSVFLYLDLIISSFYGQHNPMHWFNTLVLFFSLISHYLISLFSVYLHQLCIV